MNNTPNEKLYKESFYNIALPITRDGNMLVINTNKPAMAWLSPEAYESIHNKENLKASELRPKLIEMGFAVEQDTNELHKILAQRKYALEKDGLPTLNYVIAPTLACNMHCAYCFENCTETKKTMSQETLDAVLEAIKQQVNQNTKCRKIAVTWFGGEPTLMLNQITGFMERLNDYAKERSIETEAGIISNGLLLTRENAVQLKAAGISSVQITLDGTAGNYAKIKGCREQDFYTVIDNIKNVCGILKVTIRLNAGRYNKADIEALYKYLLSEQKLLGKVRVYIGNIISYRDGIPAEDTMSQLEFEEYKRELYNKLIDSGYGSSIPHNFPARRIVGCGFLYKSSRVFGPDGLIYKCEQCIGNPDLSVGSISGGYQENDTDKKFRDTRIPMKCAACRYLPLCGLGCRVNEAFENIPIDCEAVKYGIETAVHIHIKAARRNIQD